MDRRTLPDVRCTKRLYCMLYAEIFYFLSVHFIQKGVCPPHRRKETQQTVAVPYKGNTRLYHVKKHAVLYVLFKYNIYPKSIQSYNTHTYKLLNA